MEDNKHSDTYSKQEVMSDTAGCRVCVCVCVCVFRWSCPVSWTCSWFWRHPPPRSAPPPPAGNPVTMTTCCVWSWRTWRRSTRWRCDTSTPPPCLHTSTGRRSASYSSCYSRGREESEDDSQGVFVLVRMGVAICRHLRRVERVVLGYLEVRDPPEETSRLKILEVLQKTIRAAWPRSEHTADDPLLTLLVYLIRSH